jgi:alpha-ketoglutarate-dependent taurine dioxygenase
MTYQTITVSKLNPFIGAEIEGVDLSKPLSDRQVGEIRQAWMDHVVIAFRDQNLTVEQHLDFGRLFGELHVHPATLQPEDHPEILVVHADENSTRVAGEDWHTDVSCEEEPPMGSLLYMSEVPPDGGGDTLFASMYEAYETLSEPIKKMLIGLSAIHDGKAVYDRPGYREDRAPHRSNPSRDRAPVAVREPRLHDPDRGAEPGRERRDSPDALSARGDPRARNEVSLGAQNARLLGQPVRPAPGAMGLLPEPASRPEGDDQGRQTILQGRRSAFAENRG